MKIGITGHQKLEQPFEWHWVREQLDGILDDQPPPLMGVTSLAVGADQLFAEAILRHGGSLRTVVPFVGYEDQYATQRERQRYFNLLRSSERIEVMEATGSRGEAFLAAGKRLVEESDLVVAVWDGKPARGAGGTADIVAYAKACKKPLIIINPLEHSCSINGPSPAAMFKHAKRRGH